jgi:hypothetical protein
MQIWTPAPNAADAAQNFVQRAKEITEYSELTALMSETTRSFGFDYLTMIHHVDTRIRRQAVVAYSDYPMAYLSKVLGRRYFAEDPVLAAAERTAAPFIWSELSSLIKIRAPS